MLFISLQYSLGWFTIKNAASWWVTLIV